MGSSYQSTHGHGTRPGRQWLFHNPPHFGREERYDTRLHHRRSGNGLLVDPPLRYSTSPSHVWERNSMVASTTVFVSTTTALPISSAITSRTFGINIGPPPIRSPVSQAVARMEWASWSAGTSTMLSLALARREL